MQFSRTTTERINAADLMRLRLEEQIEKADSDRAEAKRARDESEDALLDAIGESRQEIAEAEEELKGTPKDNDEAQRPILRKLERIKTACTEQVMKLEADFRRRDEKFQVCDREARSLKKQQKDIVERVLQLIADAREGSSLFENPEEQAALGTSWRDVHIADLMGELAAKVYDELAIRTVGDALDNLASGGKMMAKLIDDAELTKEQADYLEERVRAYADAIGQSAQDDLEQVVGPPKKKSPKKKSSKKKSSKKKQGKKKAGGKKPAHVRDDLSLHATPDFPGRATAPLFRAGLTTQGKLREFLAGGGTLRDVDGLGAKMVAEVIGWLRTHDLMPAEADAA